jgi:hypothetical protein
MPTHKKLIVRRENAAVEDLERRFEQWRATPLKYHLPFLREAGRQFTTNRFARQI